MNLPDFDPQTLSAWLGASKSAIDLATAVKSLMPKGPDREAMAIKIAEAEKALKASDAMLAKGLGYHLCQCTFPPQIMLYRHDTHHHECANCGMKIRQPDLRRLSTPNLGVA